MPVAKLTKKQQAKWLPATQTFFKRVCNSLRTSQDVLLHPDTKALPREEWNTIAWNAAWIAAECFQDRTLKPQRWPAPTNAAVRKARKAGKRFVAA